MSISRTTFCQHAMHEWPPPQSAPSSSSPCPVYFLSTFWKRNPRTHVISDLQFQGNYHPFSVILLFLFAIHPSLQRHRLGFRRTAPQVNELHRLQYARPIPLGHVFQVGAVIVGRIIGASRPRMQKREDAWFRERERLCAARRISRRTSMPTSGTTTSSASLQNKTLTSN
jgi:hypothetical protein